MLGQQPRSTSRPIATISPAESQSRNWRLCLFSDLARSTAPTGGVSHVLLDELVLVARHWPVRCSASSRACSIRSIVTFIISPHITSPNLIVIPPTTLHQVIITSPHQYIVPSLTPRKPYTTLVSLRRYLNAVPDTPPPCWCRCATCLAVVGSSLSLSLSAVVLGEVVFG